MTRFDKAKAWRKRHGLTIEQLATLTGYGPRSIIWFEQGLAPPGASGRTKNAPVAEWVWHRYKMCCAGVEAQLTGKKFEW